MHVPKPLRTGHLLLASSGTEAGSSAGGGDDTAPVVAAARLMQHPTLLAHLFVAATAGGGSSLGRYLGHAPLQAATVLQGAKGLHSPHFDRGFALQQPVLLISTQAAVLFSRGGLEAVLVLPLAATGKPCCQWCCWGCCCQWCCYLPAAATWQSTT